MNIRFRLSAFFFTALCFLNSFVNAQFSYTFSSTTGTFSALSGGGITSAIGNTDDDVISATQNIGFTFTYGCSNYTQFKVSSNGWLTFNTGLIGSNAFNDLDATGSLIVAPLWDDLQCRNNVRYKLTGTAPNRVLTIEWLNMEWNYTATGAVISFQVMLYETTNVIEFIYRQETGAVTSGSASIGLNGPTVGQFYSLGGTGALPIASTTVETSNLNTKPASNQIYRFTPVAACSGTPSGGSAGATPSTISSCAALTSVLSLTGASSGCGITYQWQSAPAAGGPWTNISGATNSTYTHTPPLGTTFYRCLITCTNSGLSSTSASVSVINTAPIPSNNDCSTATNVPLNTGASCASVVSGTVSCASASSDANACFGTTDDDVWYRFVAPSSGMVDISLINIAGSTTDLYHAVYGGTCGSLTNINCSDPNTSSVSGLTPGATYYLRVYTWTSIGGQTTTFDVCLQNPCPSGPPANDNCSTATSLTVNAGSTCSTVTSGTVACASASSDANPCFGTADDDVWFSFVATGATANISLTNVTGSTTDLYHAVYTGTCGSLTNISCSDPNTSSLSSLVTGQTYYIRVYTWTSTANQTTTFDICVTNPCPSGAPANDLPCNAVTMALGVTEGGDNSCSGNASEPALPACWTNGTINTVWYRVTTTSTTLKIKTTLGTLTNTQIAVYSGTCGSLTLVASGCNDDGASCGFTSNYSSELSLTGLTAGATYFIAVDGYMNLQGTFGIVAIDGSGTWPLIAGQECMSPNPVCSSTMTVADPGYQGFGNYCDIPSSFCLASAERGSVWYQFTTNAAGNINFDIIPNNWPGAPSTAGADYDFGLWKLGAGVTCATILSGASVPLACNYSGLGVTGCSPTGNAPAAYPGFDGAYEPQVACAAGETWVLLINNHSTSVDGFTINFATGGGGVPITYVTTPTSVTWTGGTSTAWNLASNWGGCASPVCGIDATINPFTTMPTVTGVQYVRTLTINVGATLTLAAGSTLHICGDLNNYGTIIASPTSTIIFDNAAVNQAMTGTFTGTSSLGNLTITKTGGTVITNDDVTLQGTFTTSNNTSVYNSNGKYIKVAGHFYNANGATTFTNTGTTGTLEFNGTTSQNYNQGSSVLDLNFVVMNHTGTAGVNLQTDMNIKTVTGSLTLTLGKIVTNAFQVYVKNNALASCGTGNASSYVEGFLRRAITGTGAYEFPVGTALKGWERATINFTVASTTINNLRAHFNNWATVPGALGTTDCTIPYNLPFLDCGYWTINAYDASMVQITGNGTYTSTLWPRVGSYTNAGTANEWTVAKDPTNTLTWSIVATCNLASTVNQVIRDGMTGFSGFAVEQSTTALPVELVSFTGIRVGKNHLLQWSTASESNNQWFILEHSMSGNDYVEIFRTPGQMNSNTLLNYEFTNYYVQNGENYYRLKQINLDGSFSYSNVVVINNVYGNVELSNIYPNPTNANVQFEINFQNKDSYRLKIIDLAGKIVATRIYEVEEGKATLNMSVSDLSKGVYTFRFERMDGTSLSIQRLIKD